MNRVIRTIAALALAAGMAASAAAETTIKVWSMNRHDAIYVKEKIAQFNAANKHGIKVEYTIYTDNYDQAVDLAFAAKDGPDVLSSQGSVLQRYVSRGGFEPFNAYITPEIRARFDDYFVEGINTFDGKIYSMPTFGTAGRLIYNKGIFDRVGIKAPPKTLDELAAYSKLITDKLKGEGIYGFAMNLKSPRSAIDRSYEFMVQRSGGPRWGYDYRRGQYDFAFHKPFVEAFRKIFSGGSAFPGCVSLDIDPLRTQFAAGKIGMYISWSHAEPGVYASQFPTKEKWGVAALPTLDGSAKSQAVNGSGGFMISAQSKAKKEAWIVVSQLFASADYVVGYHEAGLGTTIVPEYIAVAKPSDAIKAHPALALDAKDKIWPATPLDIAASAMVVEGKDYWNTVVELFFSGADVGNTLADLSKRYNAAYAKAVAAGKLKEIRYPRFDPADPIKSTR